MTSNDLIIGAVGPLQFEVASYRLKSEYSVDCNFEGISIATARWVKCDDEKMLADFSNKLRANLAIDHAGQLVYLAQSNVNLTLTKERWPDIEFNSTREHVWG